MALDAESITAEQGRIDGLINELQHQISELRHRRNALLLICRMPDEIMLHIFHLCKTPIYGRLRGPVAHWISETTHVCRLWRDIALSSPALWSDPYFSMPLLAKEMLVRCRASLLDVAWNQVSVVEDKPKAGIQLVAQLLALDSRRLRTLFLALPSEEILDLIGNMTEAAPLLRSIDLSALPVMDVTHHVPRSLFLGSVPSLSELRLSGIRLDTMNSFCGNLRMLSLHCLDFSLVDLHETLRMTPHLRTLALESSITSLPNSHYQPAPVHLPHLRQVLVDESVIALADLLSPIECNLSTPLPDIECNFLTPLRETSLQFDIKGTTDEILSATEHISRLATWVSSRFSVPLTGLLLDGVQHELSGFIQGMEMDEDEPAPLEILFNTAEYEGPRQRLCAGFVTVLSTLPITYVTRLVLYCGSNIPFAASFWLDFFKRAQCLSSLNIGGCPCGPIVRYLAESGVGERVLFPKLKEVVLTYVTDVDVFEWWHILHARLRQQGPTHDKSILNLQACTFVHDMQEDIEELKGKDVLIEVLWDGYDEV